MPERKVRRVEETRYSRQEVLEALGVWPLPEGTIVRVLPYQDGSGNWDLGVIQVVEDQLAVVEGDQGTVN